MNPHLQYSLSSVFQNVTRCDETLGSCILESCTSSLNKFHLYDFSWGEDNDRSVLAVPGTTSVSCSVNSQSQSERPPTSIPCVTPDDGEAAGCSARLWMRSKPDVNCDSSGVAATPARTGLRSTYTLHASSADSSSNGCHFEAAGPESSRRALLVIGLAGDPFAQAPHEPG